MKIITITRHF